MDFRSRRGKHTEGKNTTKAVMVQRIYQIPSRSSLDSIHLPFFTYKIYPSLNMKSLKQAL